MKSRSVAVHLLSDRVDLVVLEGAVATAAKRIPITLDSDPCEWAKSVRHLGATLSSAVGEMKIEGAPAHVLYRSPTQAADLISLNVGSVGQAIEAARLSCIDSLPYSEMSSVCEATVVGRDAPGEERQIHVVAAAERDDVAGAIVTMIDEAGLKFISATPIDAAIFAKMVPAVMGRKSELHGVLYLGEQSSVFLVAGQGRLHFGRRIGLGLESLAVSLTRPIRRHAEAEAIELDLATARSILHEHGVPDRDKVVHEALGLTGVDLIPLLQPVLQRYIVELRQSIRFGLPEEERSEFAIRLTGPGCNISGVAELVGEELGAEVSSDAERETYDWSEPGGKGGELSDAIADRSVLRTLNLQPRSLAIRRRSQQLKRWLWAGAAAALVVLGFDAMRHHMTLEDARKEADALAGQCADVEALRATGEKLYGALREMNELEHLVAREVGPVVDFPACMKELSRLTPETIRFTTVRFYQADGGTHAALTGYAFDPEPGVEAEGLEEFVAALQSSRLFDNVVLGAVHIGETGDQAGRQFDVTFRGVGAPPQAVRELTAVTNQEIQP